MMNQDPAAWGDKMADLYDERYANIAEGTIEFLAEFTRGGRALELGVGTGRIALPLAARGVQVQGIDVSKNMVATLKAKPGGSNVPVVIGDFADVPVDGLFDLIFVAFNTFFGLTTQEAQVRCFQNVASHLNPGGCFVIEAFVPDLGRFHYGQAVVTNNLEIDRVWIGISKVDPVNQTVDSTNAMMTESGIKLFPVRLRYAWPSELDLMARLAGMRLKNRWGGWDKSLFGVESRNHVTVYELPSGK
ncbi:MAG: class I SAM-dependent methyltransferase [Chloroflexi bacterium]|nr:class I SAM-dependent methyltransferase [Chloroflexota bacterium]